MPTQRSAIGYRYPVEHSCRRWMVSLPCSWWRAGGANRGRRGRPREATLATSKASQWRRKARNQCRRVQETESEMPNLNQNDKKKIFGAKFNCSLLKLICMHVSLSYFTIIWIWERSKPWASPIKKFEKLKWQNPTSRMRSYSTSECFMS